MSVFYAKIMLFGEYGVIRDSMALTIPYSHFTGELGFINDERYTKYEFAVESNRHLLEYMDYLKKLKDDAGFSFNLDLGRMESDIAQGLYFESNIPQGYGIGSSGALVAALYDRYSSGRRKRSVVLTHEEISAMKRNFAKMESYFHGISSGLDPLLCYIRQPLLIRSKDRIEKVGIPGEKFGDNSAIFLVDTGVLGKTGPLVNIFLEKCREGSFASLVDQVFIPANNACITALLEGEMDDFFPSLVSLSSFQFEHFREMIPAPMMAFWKAGLERPDFKMKLCGSGGGGFLLGISRDYRATRDYFNSHGKELIPVYKYKHS